MTEVARVRVKEDLGWRLEIVRCRAGETTEIP